VSRLSMACKNRTMLESAGKWRPFLRKPKAKAARSPAESLDHDRGSRAGRIEPAEAPRGYPMNEGKEAKA
jgi:hypothetical protein